MIFGIKHIRSALHSPWQNGRVERFFGTLKEKIRQIDWQNPLQFKQALPEFQFWYNFCRPHQHLNGLSPLEYVQNIDLKAQKPKKVEHYSFWNGLLTGFFIRR
jgi:putative transposase